MPFEIAPQPEVKISDADAIRAGCAIAPKKCQGTLFEYKGEVLYACAAGAWLLGRGVSVTAAREYAEGPVSNERVKQLVFPVVPFREFEAFHQKVWKRNDRSDVSREHIAKLVERGEL